MSSLSDRLEHIRSNIAANAQSPDDVTIVAVTKGFDIEAVRQALEVGVHNIGENYAQEAKQKHDALTATADEPTWHFIGQLQRNKVRLLAPFVDVWQSVDNGGLISEIAKRSPRARVMIQVNLADRADRGGCEWANTAQLVETAQASGLDVLGLMGVGPTGVAAEDRPHFRRLATLRNELNLRELSMGMSGDYEVALQEGATIVRLGSILFGQRPKRATSE